MPENEEPEKAVETPEDTGQVETPPETAEDIGKAVLAEDTKTEETADELTEAVEGADSTMVHDPVLEALQSDERFKGTDFKSGADALQSFAELRSKVGQMDEERRVGRDVLGQREAWEEFLRSRQRPEEKVEPVWNPPAMPEGIEQELAKFADAERKRGEPDPEKIEAYTKRENYIRGKWGEWFQDPNRFSQEIILPVVDRLVLQRLAERDRKEEIGKVIDGYGDVLATDEAVNEVHELVETKGVPIEYALELMKLRRGNKTTQAEAAKDADLQELEQGTPAPSGVSDAKSLVEDDSGPPDAIKIGMQEMEKAGMPKTGIPV